MDKEKVIELALAAIFGGTVTYLLRFLEPKVKLAVWFPHSFFYENVVPNVSIYTLSYAVQNLGGKTAEKIEIVHKRRPDFFRLSPPLNFVESNSPSGEHIITIETLAAREFFSIEILTHSPLLPEFQYVRCKDGYAENVMFSLQRTPPRWKVAILRIFLLLGVGVSAYLLWTLSIKILGGI